MVLRHPLSESEQKIVCTPEYLQKEWLVIKDRLEGLIIGQWTNQNVVDLVDHISKSELSKKLYPGTSLGTLLISQPLNQNLNYQKTLVIDLDKENKNIILSFSDFDAIDKEEDYKKAVLWEKKCSGDKLKETFFEFLAWKKNW